MGQIIYNGRNYSGILYALNPNCYSTEEREIGCWVNGKPLYQISIPFSGINTSANTWYSLNISSYLDNPELVFVNKDTAYYIVSNVERLFSEVSYESPNLLLKTNVNRTNISGYATVAYTKTTDAAGSGKFTPRGIPTVEYSTVERVVGTWIDGSTIYECVYDLGSDITVPNNSWTYAVTIANIDKIVECKGVYSAGSYYPLTAYHNGDSVNILAARLNSSATVRYLMIQYTKSS